MGCDRKKKDTSSAFYVSIHAPAWGATHSPTTLHRKASVSIHAPAWGATVKQYAPTPTPLFQSTHPHGVRLCMSPRRSWLLWFQSTHPHGVRQRVRSKCSYYHDVSIHAPAWGATLVLVDSLSACLVSIHAPAWGATDFIESVK